MERYRNYCRHLEELIESKWYAIELIAQGTKGRNVEKSKEQLESSEGDTDTTDQVESSNDRADDNGSSEDQNRYRSSVTTTSLEWDHFVVKNGEKYYPTSTGIFSTNEDDKGKTESKNTSDDIDIGNKDGKEIENNGKYTNERDEDDDKDDGNGRSEEKDNLVEEKWRLGLGINDSLSTDINGESEKKDDDIKCITEEKDVNSGTSEEIDDDNDTSEEKNEDNGTSEEKDDGTSEEKDDGTSEEKDDSTNEEKDDDSSEENDNSSNDSKESNDNGTDEKGNGYQSEDEDSGDKDERKEKGDNKNKDNSDNTECNKDCFSLPSTFSSYLSLNLIDEKWRLHSD